MEWHPLFCKPQRAAAESREHGANCLEEKKEMEPSTLLASLSIRERCKQSAGPELALGPLRSLYLAMQDQTLLGRLQRLILFGTDFFPSCRFLISSQIKLIFNPLCDACSC